VSCKHNQPEPCPLCACSAKLDDCFGALKAIEAQPSEVLEALTGRDKAWWSDWSVKMREWANAARRSLGEPEETYQARIMGNRMAFLDNLKRQNSKP
jgi:hypothetical protein